MGNKEILDAEPWAVPNVSYIGAYPRKTGCQEKSLTPTDILLPLDRSPAIHA